MKGSGFVMVSGKDIVFNSQRSSIINLGYCKSGTYAVLQLTLDKLSTEAGGFGIYACSLNLPAFEHAISIIREKSISIESFNDTNIRGSVEPESDGLMVMSIPFDKDWHVKVDDVEVKTQAVDDCLLSFELPKGSHVIELAYYPDKLSTGLMITLTSFLILIFLFIMKPWSIASAFKGLITIYSKLNHACKNDKIKKIKNGFASQTSREMGISSET
jgi:uncharacterized membrane protein YfhO